jgi:hypothetical protein
MRLSGTIFEPDNGASISVRQVAALSAHSCSLPVRHQGSLVDPRLRASNDIRAPSKLACSLFRDGG